MILTVKWFHLCKIILILEQLYIERYNDLCLETGLSLHYDIYHEICFDLWAYYHCNYIDLETISMHIAHNNHNCLICVD